MFTTTERLVLFRDVHYRPSADNIVTQVYSMSCNNNLLGVCYNFIPKGNAST